MQAAATPGKDHIIQLDGLRFFAIFSVMIGHWLQWQINRPYVNGFPFGNGVTLFFVLSGFLITDILLRNKYKYEQAGLAKGALLKAFYIRRFLRIFPLYYGTIFFLCAVSYKNTQEIIPWLVTFTSNIYQSIHNVFVGDFNHFWSLAVEEQFYIFWPWLMILIPSSYTEKVIVSVIGISILTKSYLFSEYPDKWMANSYFTLSCMHALAIGALVAYWNLNRPGWIAAISKFNLVCTGVLVYFALHYTAYFNKLGWVNEVFDNILYAGMAALIINYAAQNKFTGVFRYVLENKFIVYSGKISYALYVFHLFVPELFWSWLSPKIGLSVTSKYTAFFVFYFITFVMAHISWILFENPINNLKRHFPYFKKEAVKQPAVAGN